jgi:L-rhamnose mutarotase
MKYRQRKKNILINLNSGSEERYLRTHCAVCGEYMDVVKDEYFKKYGFCSVKCGMKLYGLSERDFYGWI